MANLKAISGYFAGAAALVSSALGGVQTARGFRDGKYSVAFFYAMKMFLDFGVGSSSLLTALSSSASLIARLSGGRVAWLGKVSVGIAGATARAEALAAGKVIRAAITTAMDAAAKEAGVVVGERAGLLLLGRAVLFFSAWEVPIALTIAQLLIAYWQDNDLQSWMERCAFGRSPQFPLWSAGKHSEEFRKALKAVGLSQEGEA